MTAHLQHVIAWQDGRRAQMLGRTLSACPHSCPVLAGWWVRGFEFAAAGGDSTG